MSVLVLGT